MNMGTSYYKVGVLAMLLVAIASSGMLVEISNAQSMCNVSMASLMECRSAVTRPNPTAPSAACCSAISHADLNCLCSYKKSPMLTALGIDPNLATQLPAKCSIPNAPKC